MARTTQFELADADAAQVADRLGYRGAVDAVVDVRGDCVRDVPHRRTFAIEVDGRLLYRKLRAGRAADARREWDALRRLPAVGVAVPRPVLLARVGRRTALTMHAVPGRPLTELLGAASRLDVDRYLTERVAPVVARLHAAGLVHRDLYWNHWFAEALDAGAPEPHLIDVERVFRPARWRLRRWRIKDLAGLVASWPGDPRRPVLGLRFLRAYAGGVLPIGWKPLARAVLRKALRIRQHVPRHGSPPPWA